MTTQPMPENELVTAKAQNEWASRVMKAQADLIADLRAKNEAVTKERDEAHLTRSEALSLMLKKAHQLAAVEAERDDMVRQTTEAAMRSGKFRLHLRMAQASNAKLLEALQVAKYVVNNSVTGTWIKHTPAEAEKIIEAALSPKVEEVHS